MFYTIIYYRSIRCFSSICADSCGIVSYLGCDSISFHSHPKPITCSSPRVRLAQRQACLESVAVSARSPLPFVQTTIQQKVYAQPFSGRVALALVRLTTATTDTSRVRSESLTIRPISYHAWQMGVVLRREGAGPGERRGDNLLALAE